MKMALHKKNPRPVFVFIFAWICAMTESPGHCLAQGLGYEDPPHFESEMAERRPDLGLHIQPLQSDLISISNSLINIQAEENGDDEETEEEPAFAMEHVDSTFVLGRKADFEGLRMANVAADGVIILIEDNIDPVLYLRFQSLITERILVEIHSKDGQRLFAAQKRNLFVGTQLTVNHDEWPIGTHIINIRTSEGDQWKKYIKKSAPFGSNL